MKRSTFLGSCAVAALVGCNGQLPPVVDAPAAASTASVETGHSIAATFVSLKVPNMH